MRAVLAAALVLGIAKPAHADPNRIDLDRTDGDRAVDGALVGGMGATYLLIEFVFKGQLVVSQCRWCNPDGFDVDARNALKWGNTTLANDFANLAGYVAAPAAATALLVSASWNDRDWRRWVDDLAPVYESAIAVSLLQHGSKFIAARQRPFVHFGPSDRPFEYDDNVSFWSGHTSLAFSLAVSAGTVANARHYKVAPAIWATGLTLAVATGYLRIAADKHYATDVLTGAVMGSVVGWVWPRLLHHHLYHDAMLVPAGNGLAVTGRF